ncbi:MAG: DUF1887 family protein [Clostridia bacterium]|nr:DUF1887 family protein [Clostridia bacterium]
MTIIEFFDRESAVENIVGSLLYSPERVVFIGSDSKRMKKSVENYKAVLEGRGINVDFECRTVNRNNLGAITETIESIVAQSGECGIDLSGGDEFFLVAAGRILEKYKEKIRIHRLSIRNNSMIDCDCDGNVCSSMPVVLSIDENIRIYGGRVIYEGEKSGTTCRWNLDSDFISDIYAMWSICKKDVGLWNAQTNVIARLCNASPADYGLAVSAGINKEKNGPSFSEEILVSLEKEGIIKNLRITDRISFEFKNKQVKKCLTKAGQLLELVITVEAYEAKDENSNRIYNDVSCGVYIDWDGIAGRDSRIEVKNEIDVILMKGITPVFISCKNGVVDSDELYKLSVVAERFGGKYVRKILVATQLDEMGYKAEYIRARAKDMDIKIIEDVDSANEKELRDLIAKL